MTCASPVEIRRGVDTGITRNSTGRKRLNTPICTTSAEMGSPHINSATTRTPWRMHSCVPRSHSCERPVLVHVLHITPHLSAHPRSFCARHPLHSHQQVEARRVGGIEGDHVSVAVFL